MPVIGHFVARKSGHRLNNLLLRELMNRRDCWRIVTALGRQDTATERTGLKPPAFSILDAVAVRA
jgi:UDP-3-O-[3-hydroxymyristoyl] N-acetylglucosamine deacetylase